MKYASVFATILFIWIAAIFCAMIIVDEQGQVFNLYLATVVMTFVLFIIGFGKK